MGRRDPRRTRRVRDGAAKAGIVIALVVLSPLVVGFEDSPEGKNRKGNAHYRKGEFDQALTEYRGAQVLAPELSELSFNAGDALFRKGEYEKALREFASASAAADSLLASGAYYNAGNTLLAMGNPEAAIEAYKAALRGNPGDPDAKYNLELALRFLEQQQQEQQGEGQENKDKGGEDKQGEEQKDQEQKDQEQGQDEEDESQASQGQAGSQEQQPPQAEQAEQEPSMSEEDAARLLDAVQEAEQELQEELRAVAKKRTKVDKDW